MADTQVRESFLSAVLGLEPGEIRTTDLVSTFLKKEFPDEKQGILDVKVLLNREEPVNLEIHLLELPKLRNGSYPENPLLYWAQFINSTKKEEFEMLAMKDPGLERAYERLKLISANPERRQEYEAREKALRDYHHQIESYYASGEEAGYSRGKEVGYDRGKEEGYNSGHADGFRDGNMEGIQNTKRALRLAAGGKQAEEIAETLGLSMKEVDLILN